MPQLERNKLTDLKKCEIPSNNMICPDATSCSMQGNMYEQHLDISRLKSSCFAGTVTVQST